MKLITLLLLLIAVNCSGQKRNGIIPQPFNFSLSKDTDHVAYRFVIYPYGKIKPAAYLTMDSVLVVNDSCETINTLIRSSLKNGEEIKRLYYENERLRKMIKQSKEYEAFYALKPHQ